MFSESVDCHSRGAMALQGQLSVAAWSVVVVGGLQLLGHSLVDRDRLESDMPSKACPM